MDEKPPGKFAAKLALLPLCTLLVVWAWTLWTISDMRLGPNGITFDNTLATYLSSAKAQQTHGNPYDVQAVCTIERHMLRAQAIPVHQPTWNCRVGNPPVFFWFFQPWIHVSYRISGYAWLVLLELASVTGLLGVLSAFGWRKRLLPCLVFLLMPPVTYATYYGEIDGIMFAGIGLALALARRQPGLAGALFVVAWLKVPMGLPILGLTTIFYVPDRARFLRGFAMATSVLLVLTLLTTGWESMGAWVHSLVAFSADTAVRGHQASLVGLYVRWAPAHVRLAFEAAALLGATTLTWWYWAKRHVAGDPFVASAWLWAVWFLVTPYGQYYDEIFLAVPVLALVGRDGRNVTRASALLALYGLFFSVVLAFRTANHVDPLSLPLVGLTVILAAAARQASVQRKSDSDGLRHLYIERPRSV